MDLVELLNKKNTKLKIIFCACDYDDDDDDDQANLVNIYENSEK